MSDWEIVDIAIAWLAYLLIGVAGLLFALFLWFVIVHAPEVVIV